MSLNTREKVRSVFNYLGNLKKSQEKRVRHIGEYERVFFERELLSHTGCKISTDENCVLEISKEDKELYNYFFNLHQQIENKSKSLEIVLGKGLVTWMKEKETIVHTMFSIRLELEFKVEKAIFCLKSKGNMEMDTRFLEGLNIHNYSKLVELQEEIRNKNIKISNLEYMNNYYEPIINILSVDNDKDFKICNERIFKEDIEITSKVNILDNLVILIREYDVTIWNEEINQILKQIDQGYEIPKTIEALVTNQKIEHTESEKDEWRELEKDLLFPLPYNAEQKEIANRLSSNFGLVVQGPPGTGKSHTIANLICHLLAHGKSVLVTSETDRALKVLKKMIPEEISSLCMSVIGNENKDMDSLESSVRNITDNLSINPIQIQQEIGILRIKLSECKRNQDNVIDKLKYIWKNENAIISYHGRDYSIMEIAKWLKENEDECSWIEDDVNSNIKSPVSESEFEEVIGFLNEVPNREREMISKILPILDKMPTYDELYNVFTKYEELKNNYDNNKRILEKWNISDNKGFDYERLIELLEEGYNKLNICEEKELDSFIKDFNNSALLRDSAMDLLLRWKSYIKRISVIRNELNQHCITLPQEVNLCDLERDFEIVFHELDKKGKISKWFTLKNKSKRYVIDKCLVDGNPISDIYQATILKLYFEKQQIIKGVTKVWNSTFKNYKSVCGISEREEDLIKAEKYIYKIENLCQWTNNIKPNIINKFGAIVIPNDIDLNNREGLLNIKQCCKAIKEIYEFQEIQIFLDSIIRIMNNSGFSILCEALEKRDIEKLQESFKEVERLRFIRNRLNRINEILYKIKGVCPRLYTKLTTEESLNMKSWNNAWKWKEWDSILKGVWKQNEEWLEGRLQEEKQKEKALIRQLVYKETWFRQICSITEEGKRSLFSWLQAVKRIGKGTGKFVNDYIQIAQKEMENCKEAIPVWIMPLNRLLENIKLSNKQFDVIICDESSQSNIYTLCALMRAKKAIIVGDDKQISPEVVGISHGEVQKYINAYLKNIPNKEWFDLSTSLYDTALRVFPDRVVLREHFRSVPEIIQFNNKLCYNDEIATLRFAHKNEKFDPPVCAVKVNGIREKNRPLNIIEAEAIVDRIYKICNDKIYNGMSIGVISLLGDAQTEFIQALLRDKIGDEEITKRKIVCGDAYSFQGDERDIMFLSMVVANNIKYTVLNRESDIRRFNVATSRARNQIWVFHSVDLEDLNKECVRYKLLDYCKNYDKYKREEKVIENIFYSTLQKDIYSILKSNGFNPLSNVSLGNYTIDLVLENGKDKIAILCQDEKSKYTSNYHEFYNMQLKLMECGWNVIKVRGSKFYRYPDKMIPALLKRLQSFTIIKSSLEDTKKYIRNDNLRVV